MSPKSFVGSHSPIALQERPWIKDHSWQAFREQYVRNTAQYDFWIQRYVDENPELLDQVAERLIEDFRDEPGAFEDELSQEEHGYIIASAPNRSTNAEDQWPPARAVGPTAGNRSNGSSSRRGNAPQDVPRYVPTFSFAISSLTEASRPSGRMILPQDRAYSDPVDKSKDLPHDPHTRWEPRNPGS